VADEPHDRVLVREDPDDVGSALDLLIQLLQRIRRMQLGSMLRGEGHVGEHVMLGPVHQPAELLEPGPQLIGDVPPDLARRLVVGLDEGLVDSVDNRLLRLWHEGQRIAHCHVAPTTRWTAAFSPSCASEITSLTPRRPPTPSRLFEDGNARTNGAWKQQSGRRKQTGGRRRRHIRPPKSSPRRPSASWTRSGRSLSPNWLEPMSIDEMIACMGSCRARSDLAAMIEALSLDRSLNTPVETMRLEAARAAMADWKAYSHACQARHNARRLRLNRRPAPSK
jgi:hypothetical protein